MVNETQRFYVLSYFIFAIFTGALFFAGGNLLLVVFALTLAEVFLVLGAYAANSPYSHIGAERELIQIMAYEPMFLLAAVGMYVVTKSFNVSDIAGFPGLIFILLPGVFLGFLYVLTIKLRKSPFDISTSHHAHQEIVKGVTTEFSGPALGFIETHPLVRSGLPFGLRVPVLCGKPGHWYHRNHHRLPARTSHRQHQREGEVATCRKEQVHEAQKEDHFVPVGELDESQRGPKLGRDPFYDLLVGVVRGRDIKGRLAQLDRQDVEPQKHPGAG